MASQPTNQHNTTDRGSGTFLVAVARDPEWIFLFWELADTDFDHALAAIHATRNDQCSRRVLRLLDVTDINYNGANAWRIYDTAITDTADNWYFKVPESGRDYLFEIGLLHLDGSFAAIARSNLVSAPTGRVSEEIDEEWSSAGSDQVISASSRALSGDYSSSGMPLQHAPYLGSGANNP